MILISHRGNTIGPDSEYENYPDHINNALAKGFNVEVDVWRDRDGDFYLGHDFGKFRIDITYLINDKLWCHAKNKAALDAMLENKFIHCFWHEDDAYTLTSKNFIWTYPGRPLSLHSICVLPEKDPKYIVGKCAGICSDYIQKYK